MKKNRRIPPVIISLILVCVFVMSCLPQNAFAVTKAEIEQLKEESEELNVRIGDIQSQLEELSRQEFKTLAQKQLYDEQCALLSNQIAITESQISEYEELIVQAKKELDAAIAAEKAQHALMCTRVRSMEERGSISYLEILFDATSFSDFIGRLDLVKQIKRYDAEVIESYRERQQETIERQQELNALLDETESAKAELEVQKSELEAKRKEAEDLLIIIENNEAEYQALLEELEEEDRILDEKISSAEAEYEEEIRRIEEARAAAAAYRYSEGGGASANGISFIWPAGSSYDITSYFGYRSAESTGGVGSTNHMGIDIGNVGYSTPVLAAADGVVIIAQNSSSAGNYVSVSHGNGVTTVYMHMSYLTVSPGETVYQGQQLGVTGSTGNSSGPHLHFGVKIGDGYVDPLDYLP